MGNIFRKLFGKEDFVAVLEQLAKEIGDAEHRLFAFRVSWRNTTSRLTYLFLLLELAYLVYWWFFTPAGAPHMDTALHALTGLTIPLVWYLFVLLIGTYYKYRISSTEALIEELSERQDSKIEAFKEKGSYKEVSRVLGSLETPNRGGKRQSLGGASTSRAPLQTPSRPSNTQNLTSASTTKKNPPKRTTSPTTKRVSKDDASISSDKPAVASSSTDPINSTTVTTKRNPMAGDKSEVGSREKDTPAQTSNNDSSARSANSENRVGSTMNQGNEVPRTQPQRPQQQKLILHPVPVSPYRSSAPSPAQMNAHSMQNAAPASKGWMDTFLDILIGSSSSIPKICSRCGAHNGFVPVEEQYSVQFVCHMCKAWNDASAASKKSSAPPAQASSSSSSGPSKDNKQEPSVPEATSSTTSEKSGKAKRHRKVISPGAEPDASDSSDHNSNQQEEVLEAEVTEEAAPSDEADTSSKRRRKATIAKALKSRLAVPGEPDSEE